MFLSAIPFPNIDPVAFSIGPIDVRWYSIAYIVGLLFAIWFAKRLIGNLSLWGNKPPKASPAQIDDLLLWVTLGVILGGRIGYVLFYKPSMITDDPLQILQLWNGGMSFHGGFLGVVLATYVFGRKHAIPFLQLLDLAAVTVPVGLGLGRLANFIRGELFGRVSDVPWAMVFPGGGPLPRHPSQLYEFALEGVVLFTILMIAVYKGKVLSRSGMASGIFGIGYGLSRIIVEFARQPDAHVGYIIGQWATLGMLYSLPVIAAGIWLVIYAKRST
ncbi:MAG TPA: prolipoprotein diacylglyceryl transferase [Rhizobiales bacterium]|nr:prolipoprotein diacylglyceryl transferase [Hyphomicrobiales bacterium]